MLTKMKLICRWYIICEADARTGLRDDVGPVPTTLREADGWTPLHPRPLWGGFLGGRHPQRPRRLPLRHHRHGAEHERNYQRPHCHGIHRHWGALQCGLHGCGPTHLHVFWTREYTQNSFALDINVRLNRFLSHFHRWANDYTCKLRVSSSNLNLFFYFCFRVFGSF